MYDCIVLINTYLHTNFEPSSLNHSWDIQYWPIQDGRWTWKVISWSKLPHIWLPISVSNHESLWDHLSAGRINLYEWHRHTQNRRWRPAAILISQKRYSIALCSFMSAATANLNRLAQTVPEIFDIDRSKMATELNWKVISKSNLIHDLAGRYMTYFWCPIVTLDLSVTVRAQDALIFRNAGLMQKLVAF